MPRFDAQTGGLCHDLMHRPEAYATDYNSDGGLRSRRIQVTRRNLFAALLIASRVVRAADKPQSIRGKLRETDPPALQLPDGRKVMLSGDESTLAVLHDERIADSDFEVQGSPKPPAGFLIDGIHLRSMFVHKDGMRLMVTYWCDVCYIRTYVPGKCWCCQKYTDLDLRESLE